jgi:hypothetical protein
MDSVEQKVAAALATLVKASRDGILKPVMFGGGGTFHCSIHLVLSDDGNRGCDHINFMCFSKEIGREAQRLADAAE